MLLTSLPVLFADFKEGNCSCSAAFSYQRADPYFILHNRHQTSIQQLKIDALTLISSVLPGASRQQHPDMIGVQLCI